jgi:hypothetical protein
MIFFTLPVIYGYTAIHFRVYDPNFQDSVGFTTCGKALHCSPPASQSYVPLTNNLSGKSSLFISISDNIKEQIKRQNQNADPAIMLRGLCGCGDWHSHIFLIAAVRFIRYRHLQFSRFKQRLEKSFTEIFSMVNPFIHLHLIPAFRYRTKIYKHPQSNILRVDLRGNLHGRSDRRGLC